MNKYWLEISPSSPKDCGNIISKVFYIEDKLIHVVQHFKTFTINNIVKFYKIPDDRIYVQ